MQAHIELANRMRAKGVRGGRSRSGSPSQRRSVMSISSLHAAKQVGANLFGFSGNFSCFFDGPSKATF